MGARMTEFKSAFDSLTGFGIQQLPPAERRRRWEQDREAVAGLWFGGNLDRADQMLDSLPYSAIPEWGDVDRVMRLVESATGALGEQRDMMRRSADEWRGRASVAERERDEARAAASHAASVIESVRGLIGAIGVPDHPAIDEAFVLCDDFSTDWNSPGPVGARGPAATKEGYRK